MAYEPLNFENFKTVLTAEQLNHMQDGIANVLPQNPGAYQYPATDGDGNMVWADRLAYEESGTIKTIDPKFLRTVVNLDTLTKAQAIEYAKGMANIGAVSAGNRAFYPLVSYNIRASSPGDDCCGCGPQSAYLALSSGQYSNLETFDITDAEYNEIATAWGLS